MAAFSTKKNIVILIFFLGLWWFFNKKGQEFFGTSPGTMQQLATSSTDPSWFYGYMPTYPVQYTAPYPMYSQYPQYPRPHNESL